MQVQDDAGARRAGRGEPAPAEGRVHVVGVDDVGTGAAHGGGDVVLVDAATQHRDGGTPAPQHGRVALEHLDVLAELLAHEPRDLLDRTLLAAGRPVAVVEEEDHRRASSGPASTPAFSTARSARSMNSRSSPRTAATGAPTAESRPAARRAAGSAPCAPRASRRS